MPVSAYTGVPGSGKSYEVVTEVILGALRIGRRIVSNVAGLHFEEMRAWLLMQGVLPEAIGSLEIVTSEQISARGFWPVAGSDSIVQPGDLVVLDECWRWMSAGVKIPPDMFAYLREHRHAVSAAGVSSDVVLITQSIQDLDRKVRVVVEKFFVMEKLKRLGLTKQYTVDVYNGYKIDRRNCLRRIIRKYKPEFFAFYSSYEAKGAEEKEVDKRINVFNNPWILAGGIGAVGSFIGGAFWLHSIYQHVSHPVKPPLVAAAAAAARTAAPAAGKPLPVGGEGALAGLGEGGAWRVVGWYGARTAPVFVLRSGAGVRFVYGAAVFSIRGQDARVTVDGVAYTSYSGGGEHAPRAGAVPAGAAGLAGPGAARPAVAGSGPS